MGDAPESGLWSLEKGALKAYLGTEASLVLPSQVQGQAVTAVGPNFLRENAQVIRVNFPEGIDRIEDSAFYYCESLLEVTLPRTLQKIGRYAFFGCRGLTHIDIPASAALIERDAFAFCDALEAVTFMAGTDHCGSKCLFAHSGRCGLLRSSRGNGVLCAAVA